MPSAGKFEILICDFDNTLYDWLGYFVPSFYAMVDKAIEITGCDRETLLDDFRKVHQMHGDSEHPFALLETDTIRTLYQGKSVRETADALDRALYAFNAMRKRTLHLHDGVAETLSRLAEAGLVLVAHTESKLYATVDRLRRLDLMRFFARVYCYERGNSVHPDRDLAAKWLDGLPMERIVELSRHQRKPSPDVLLEICERENIDPAHAAYVGDSVARDVMMAKRAKVFSVWAAYGASHEERLYQQLVRVSHWTEQDVQRELKLREAAKSVKPDFVARTCFSEVLRALNFENGAAAAAG